MKTESHLKGSFTCENKKDINGLLEYQKELHEEIHQGWICNIIDVEYKYLNIGLIDVKYQYEMTQTQRA